MSKDALTAGLAMAAGSILLLAAAIVPAHWRTVDDAVVRTAGEGTPTLIDLAQRALDKGRVAPARRLLDAAGESAGDDELQGCRERIEAIAADRPTDRRWGGPNPWLDRYVGHWVATDRAGERPGALAWLLHAALREALLKELALSSKPAVMALVNCRQIESTSLLPPVPSASGAPMDAALLGCALLVAEGRMHDGFAVEWERTAATAIRDGQTLALEAMLLDFLAAARRLEWEELAFILEHCGSGAELRALVMAAGQEGERWTQVFAAMTLAGTVGRVGAFLAKHGEAGRLDLEAALPWGEGAVQTLVLRGQRMERSQWRTWVVERLRLGGAEAWLAGVAGRAPRLAWACRCLLWLDGFFLVAMGMWFGRRAVLAREWAGMPRAPDYGLVGATALAATVLTLLSSERWLDFKPEAKPARAGIDLRALQARLRFEVPHATKQGMNEKVLGMMAAFFAIQVAIYLIGLGRVRQIRGRPVEGSIKLKLLDNEETLFDAPLYVGIGGSVLALVLRMTGLDEVSLMASYSSTLFGILFCFVLKVMHVRPYRQQLILESTERDLP